MLYFAVPVLIASIIRKPKNNYLLASLVVLLFTMVGIKATSYTPTGGFRQDWQRISPIILSYPQLNTVLIDNPASFGPLAFYPGYWLESISITDGYIPMLLHREKIVKNPLQLDQEISIALYTKALIHNDLKNVDSFAFVGVYNHQLQNIHQQIPFLDGNFQLVQKEVIDGITLEVYEKAVITTP